MSAALERRVPVLAPELVGEGRPAGPTRHQFHSTRFRAMGCGMAAWVVAAQADDARRQLGALRRWFRAAEARLSRFRPASELSRLNQRSGQPVAVSPLLGETIVLALRAAERTDGLYDPTILAALEAAGYDRSFEAVANDDRRIVGTVPRAPAWRAVQVRSDARQVSLPLGARLDLGGVAKAMAADRAADRLGRIGPCLVDAGGDIAARGAPLGHDGWPIGVADPRRPALDLALLLVRDRGVATSGTDFRRWRRGGQLQHHLVDPRTGRPAQTDVLSATVVAASVVEANVHALVAVLLGARDGYRYLASQSDAAGLLVRDDGRLLATPSFERYVRAWDVAPEGSR